MLYKVMFAWRIPFILLYLLKLCLKEKTENKTLINKKKKRKKKDLFHHKCATCPVALGAKPIGCLIHFHPAQQQHFMLLKVLY